MKEQYVKPKIFFESFSLTQTIARACGAMHDGTLGEPNSADEYTCNWVFPSDEEDEVIYLFFVDACEDSWVIGDPEPGEPFEYENICYNNPEGGQEIFSSL